MTTQTDSLLHRYKRELGPILRLTGEQETLLWQKWRLDGDRRARDQLIQASLHHVLRLATRYRGYCLPALDLICEGNYGVVCALQKFESERGYRFMTYAAYWIRAHMLRYIVRSHSLVSTDSGSLRTKMFFRLKRERARIYALMGEEEEAHEELARRMNLSPERLQEFEHRLGNRDAALFDAFSPEHRALLVETLASPCASPEDEYVAKQDASNVTTQLFSALDHLDRRERYVLESAVMCDDDDTLTLAEIGRRLGVSRERTRQLEARALMKLRRKVPGLQ